MSVRVPDVSVIVAVHNGMPHLGRTLGSLARQSLGLARMQVIVVDDGSTDSTPAVIDAWARKHRSAEVVHQPNSGGPAGPRNLALTRVRGRYVLFLDADDHLALDALSAMVGIADANGTDVVLARMKGAGGRTAPRSMFTRTIARTDVLHSWAYWSLNPMKLFRTEMVRSLDLDFPLDFPWGEDQPFVAAAYLMGDGISILADKDYIFWTYGEPGANITTRAVSLRDRMPVASHMFDFVAARVPEGAGRDRLLQRHFAAELYGSAFEGFRIETDPTARADAFRRFREIVESYYTPGIAAALRPEARVLIHLIKQDRADAFGRYLDALAEAGPSALLAEGDTSYLRLPWFREPGQGLPDALFEVGARLRADCRVEPVVIGARGARFRATSRLGMRTGGPTGVTLIARPLASAEEASVPLAHTVADDESRQLVSADDAQALGRLVSALPAGTYDLFVRVAADGRWRERRVAECAPPPAPRRIVRAFPFWSAAKVGALQTTEGGKLRLRVLDMRSIAAAAGRSMAL